MIKIKRYVPIAVWILVLTAMIASVAFTNVKQQEVLCKSVNVIIEDNGQYFVEASDVMQMISSKAQQPVGKPVSLINTAVLEKCINANPFVANAQIFLTIDGIMHVKVMQRNPVMRIMTDNGESFYVDDQGIVMPLSDKYSSNVVVASGRLSGNLMKRKYTEMVFVPGDTSNNSKMPDQLYSIASCINRDSVFNALIEQIYVNQSGEIELIPRIGDQVILFGDAGNIESKFANLLTFYKKGLNKIGWTNYSKINLKYDNQVVVEKRNGAEKEPVTSVVSADSSQIN